MIFGWNLSFPIEFWLLLFKYCFHELFVSTSFIMIIFPISIHFPYFDSVDRVFSFECVLFICVFATYVLALILISILIFTQTVYHFSVWNIANTNWLISRAGTVQSISGWTNFAIWDGHGCRRNWCRRTVGLNAVSTRRW